MRLLITTLLLIFHFNSLLLAQSKDSLPLKRPYFFVFVNADANLHGKVMPTSGLRLDLSVNLARFFTKKIVLGLFYESSFNSKFSTNRRTNYLQADIENNLQPQTNSYDSVMTHYLHDSYTNNRFKGAYHSNWGVAFSPFPDKYGEVMFLISRGRTHYPFTTQDISDPEIPRDFFLEVPCTFKFTAIFKPLTLTKMSDKNFLKDHLHLGFYIQDTRYSDATIGNNPLKNYLKPDFFKGNRKHEIQFGMRIGIGLGFVN